MARQIIKANPDFKREVDKNQIRLDIAECFTETLQGEGITTGVPSTFLRLQHCTLNCVWCDSTTVWRYGNPYTIHELLDLWEEQGVIQNLMKGEHLVLTGGSPLRQQSALISLLMLFSQRYGVKPFIEIENECVLMPYPLMDQFVNQWNNSPKLSNSGMRRVLRYKPDVLRITSLMENSWFKFVIDGEEDYQEIFADFIEPGVIGKDQVILMPKGSTRDELLINGQLVAEMAIKYKVRYSDRLQVTLWDQTTGV